MESALRTTVDDHLRTALESAEDRRTKFHLRQALQLLQVEER